MWKEEVTVHPLRVDGGLVMRRDRAGGDREWFSPLEIGSADEPAPSARGQSFLVHARFKLGLDGGAYGRAQDADESLRSLVPSAIDALLGQGGVTSLDVTYTRGHVGTYQLPAWYVQRGAGLVVMYETATQEGEEGENGKRRSSGDGAAGSREVLTVISRMLGSSAPSMLDARSYVVDGNTFRGYLTQDFPCIESIGRWMRLLPCGGQAGVSEVLQGLRLLELPYHSIRVAVDGTGERGVLTIEVSGIVHETRGHEGGRGVEMMASRNSHMNRERTDGASSLHRLVEGRRSCIASSGSDVTSGIDRDDQLRLSVSTGILPRYGEARNWLVGTLQSVIRVDGGNRSEGGNRSDGGKKGRVVYRQLVPWEVGVDVSSLVARDGSEHGGIMDSVNVTDVRWTEAEGREHAGLLEVDIDLWLERSGPLVVDLDFERPILSVFDYPADMSRGVDIPAPEVTLFVAGGDSVKEKIGGIGGEAVKTTCSSHEGIKAAGQNVLVRLPIPDASMPFNVACFTATMLSLLFGALMPVLLWEEDELKKVQSAKRSLKARLKRMVLALLVAGTVMFYLDVSTRATVKSTLNEVLRALPFDLDAII